MKKTILYSLLAVSQIVSCTPQTTTESDRLSNDEYDRLYMANKEFTLFDTDKNGILTSSDADNIENIWFQRNCRAVLEKANADIPKDTYINDYKTPVSTIDAKLYQNIEYKEVNGCRMMMDIYVPNGKENEKVPVVAFYHGGGWHGGDKYLCLDGGHNQTLNSILERGIAVAAVNYRLTNLKDSFVVSAAEDCLDAFAFLNRDGEKYGLDTSRMGVWGGSAGGHLAQMVAFCGAGDIPGDKDLAPYRVQPSCAVVWYGPCKINMPSREEFDAMEDKSNYKKFTLSTDYDVIAKCTSEISPLDYVDSADPCALIMCGDLDFPEKAYMLGAKMDECGVSNEVFIVKNSGHSWMGDNIIPDRDGIGVITADYLLQNL